MKNLSLLFAVIFLYIGSFAQLDVNHPHPKSKKNNEVNQVGEMKSISFNLYPNPASSDLYVKIYGEGGKAVISIYDAHGKLIQIESSTEPTSKLDVSDLKNGLYHVVVMRDGLSERKTFIRSDD